jgi:EAL domain-containing protein (putative c-di-GMP-specific phosphodiesterase class I)
VVAVSLHFVTASIGIGVARPSGQRSASAELLIRDADAAMYRAKEGGRARCVLFDAEMRASAIRRLEVERELRHALDRDELALHYQPVVSLRTGEIAGLEALVRWQHPQRGLLLPGRFLPVAERGGLIIPIGRWALMQACHAAAAWPDGPAGPLGVAVNVHPDQLRDPRLTEDVRRALDASGLPAARLTLEITESAVILDPRAAAGTLGRLRDMGITIAVDDFGTGYASLSYLQDLPVNVLKVDKAFIASLPDTTPVAITRTILQLAAALGLTTIAEGIETDSQLNTCRELGCQHGQGFLFAEAMPDSVLTDALLTRR